jgi:hypothetical protein
MIEVFNMKTGLSYVTFFRIWFICFFTVLPHLRKERRRRKREGFNTPFEGLN